MPLILLAGALKAVEAIQQGCELYKEYKGTVLQAKATFDEAKGIAIEVADVGTGIWDFIKSKVFPPTEKPPNVAKTQVKTEEAQETPEQAKLIYAQDRGTSVVAPQPVEKAAEALRYIKEQIKELEEKEEQLLTALQSHKIRRAHV